MSIQHIRDKRLNELINNLLDERRLQRMRDYQLQGGLLTTNEYQRLRTRLARMYEDLRILDSRIDVAYDTDQDLANELFDQRDDLVNDIVLIENAINEYEHTPTHEIRMNDLRSMRSNLDTGRDNYRDRHPG
jgi:hypothetical protein